MLEQKGKLVLVPRIPNDQRKLAIMKGGVLAAAIGANRLKVRVPESIRMSSHSYPLLFVSEGIAEPMVGKGIRRVFGYVFDVVDLENRLVREQGPFPTRRALPPIRLPGGLTARP